MTNLIWSTNYERITKKVVEEYYNIKIPRKQYSFLLTIDAKSGINDFIRDYVSKDFVVVYRGRKRIIYGKVRPKPKRKRKKK